MRPTKEAPPTEDRTGDFYDFEALIADADRELPI